MGYGGKGQVGKLVKLVSVHVLYISLCQFYVRLGYVRIC